MSFERRNEGELVKDPRFVCEECGFANVRLTTFGESAGAICTSCGVRYLSEGGEQA